MLEYLSVNDLMEHDDYVNFMGCNITTPFSIYCKKRWQESLCKTYSEISVVHLLQQQHQAKM